MKRTKTILGDLNINLLEFNKKDSSGNYLYDMPNVVSVRRMSNYLPSWSGPDITSVIEDMTSFSDVPLLCEDKKCPFSEQCPLSKNNLLNRWVGNPCPLDQIMAFRLFAGYVNDMEISPEDFTDLKLVNDLIRLNIQLDRAEKLIRKESPVETMVSGVDAKTDLKHNTRQPNQLIALQKSLRADISSTLKQLLGTRQAKLDALAKTNNKASASDWMADVMKKAKEVANAEVEQEVKPGSHLEI
jgi:hypothetical protein